MTLYARVWKRSVELGLALVALVLVAPVLGSIAALILARMGRPILFRQPRAGRAGRPFTLLKFRTMSAAAGGGGSALSDAERLTRLGRFLRSWSLDELPELVNVVRGDMSLVGPRPLLMEYLDRYTPEQARRHEVRPGITGWAQIHGRNELGWEERFRLDVWYVDHVSLGLDLKILGRTLIQVLGRKGIAARGHATMPPFTGSTGPGQGGGARGLDGT